ncbi:hypothetical protein EOM33_00055 [Candidatus Saccharibacteria bacterium]|nr:hypothetical protein [Candidatus Saccharibacteria bacterium]
MAKQQQYDTITLQSIYQADLAKYQTITDSSSSLDTKNGLLIGAIVAVGTFIFQEPLFAKVMYSCFGANYGLFSVLLLGAILLVGALAIGIYAIFPRKWRYPSNTAGEQPDYLDKNANDALLQLISDLESILPEVEGIMKLKAKLFMIGLSLFILATFLLIIVQQNI